MLIYSRHLSCIALYCVTVYCIVLIQRDGLASTSLAALIWENLGQLMNNDLFGIRFQANAVSRWNSIKEEIIEVICEQIFARHVDIEIPIRVFTLWWPQ